MGKKSTQAVMKRMRWKKFIKAWDITTKTDQVICDENYSEKARTTMNSRLTSVLALDKSH